MDSALNAIARRADAIARSVVPDRGIAVGSEHERSMQRSEALMSVVRLARRGLPLDEVAAVTKAAAREAIKRHNARRPTCPNWGVDAGAYDALIDEAIKEIRV